MARPQKIVNAVLYTLQESGLPSESNFVGYEPDTESESIKLPLVEVSTDDKVNADLSNTEFVGFRQDNNGNDIGRIYETLYTLTLTVKVWTAHDSKFSPRDLGDAVRTKLYSHTTGGPEESLRDPKNDSPIDEVWRFDLLESERTDDLGTSPTLRRLEQTISVSASEQYLTDADKPPIAEITETLSTSTEDGAAIESYNIGGS